MAHTWPMSPAWSAVFRIAGLSLVGLISWRWFSLMDELGWKNASLVMVVALTALAGILWQEHRVRADRRWRAVLDRYAEMEQAKWTYSRRRSHAGSQSQVR
jgi:hypothetical protein